MIIYDPAETPETISVVDLSGSFSPDLEQRKAVAWRMHKAVRETGFFYVADALEEPSCTVRLLHYPPQPTVTFGEHVQEMFRKTYGQAA
ncbi:MAG: hypothetical protein P4L73_09270 [Caulobacteraceae bacterium]|nr:hypothetical protein [Caulobacteraceae bacterium]